MNLNGHGEKPAATHSASCSSCGVGVSADLETVARWAVVHGRLPAELERPLVEAARSCRVVQLDYRGEHLLELGRVVVDPRPAGLDLHR